MARDLSEDAVQVQNDESGLHHRHGQEDLIVNHHEDEDSDDDVDGEMLYTNFLSQRFAEEQIQFPQYQYEQFQYRNYVSGGRDSLTSDRFDR